MRFSTLALLLLTISFSIEAQTTHDILSSDDFALKATLWEQPVEAPLAILLHQCDADQTMYKNIAQSLNQAGFHVLTVDNRGIGKSVSEKYNIAKAEDRGNEWTKVNAQTENDLNAILSFINERFSGRIESYAIMGASCAGSKALYLVEKLKNEVMGFGILSARMSETGRKRFEELVAIPGLFIAAKGDKRAYETAIKGEELSQSEKSVLLTYSGRAHANALFRVDRNLEEKIADWFISLKKQ